MLSNNQNSQTDDEEMPSQEFEDLFGSKGIFEVQGGELVNDLDKALDSIMKKEPVDEKTLNSIEGNIESIEETLRDLKDSVKQMKQEKTK